MKRTRTILRKSYLLRVFILVFLSMACLVLGLEGFLFYGLNLQYRRNSQILQQNQILQVQQSTETLLRQAEKLAVSMSWQNEVKLYSAKGFPLSGYEQFRRSQEIFGIIISGAIGEYFHSFSLYHAASDRVFTSPTDSVKDRQNVFGHISLNFGSIPLRLSIQSTQKPNLGPCVRIWRASYR